MDRYLQAGATFVGEIGGRVAEEGASSLPKLFLDRTCRRAEKRIPTEAFAGERN